MKKTRLQAIVLLSLVLVALPMVTGKTITTPLGQTVPGILTSTRNAVAGCSVLNLSPGSAVADQAGFIEGNCPSDTPAMIMGNATETPTFVAPPGLLVALMFNGFTCSFRFILLTGRLLGANMTSGSPLVFTGNSSSTTQLLEGGYNYCFYYSTPPASGFASFVITWTP